MKTGIELIAEERVRQIAQEGWTPEHDDAHRERELAQAGAAYAYLDFDSVTAKAMWPWRDVEFNPKEDPIRNLARAGALIAAEMDRIQRYSPSWRR